MMAMFMAAVESTIVATAMPTIIADLGGFHLFSWVFAAYLLPQAVTIPVYGRLADLYGRKRVLFVGSGIFLVGSALCGFAQGMPSLVAFRALQGLGAGSIIPITTTIIGDIYDPTERVRVQGYVSSMWGFAAVAGPLLGAFLVEQLNWATVFWINLPVGAVSILMLAATFHEKLQPRRHRIDYIGAVLLMGGTGALILALVQATELGREVVAVLLIGAALALAALVYYEKRTVEPMMPLDLWRHRVIAAVNLGGLAIGAVMMATAAFLPTYVQGVMGLSAFGAGLVLAAMSLAWPIGSTLAGRLMIRSSYRMMAAIGGGALVAGSVVLVMLDPARGPYWAGVGAFFTGIGMGFCNITYIVSAQSSVDWSRRGIATSSTLFMRMLGQAIGSAIFGGILNSGLSARVPEAGDAVDRLMEPARRAGLGTEMIARLADAVAFSLHQVFWVAGLLAAVSVAFAFILPARLGPRHAQKS
ncbi:MAG TPA: MDR family MFS transporter [Alphaproteobacteria bacterium]|nr:MDR family MFS transporter [Alphaproteobacteria bacterium]